MQKQIHTQLPKLAVGALLYLSGLTNFDSRQGQLFKNGLKKITGVKGRKKKERDCDIIFQFTKTLNYLL